MSTDYSKRTSSHGFISTEPLPNVEELQKYYAETYYQSPQSSTYQESYDDLEIDYKNLKCNALIHALSALSPSACKTFLDVGAGEGFLLNAADKQGFEVKGLDFSAYGVSKFFPHLSTKHTSGDVFESLSFLVKEGQKFDICTSTNVLEHVLDPDIFLQTIKKLMAPKGLLAITVPNDYSDIQLLALEQKKIDREFWFVPPHHLHYFNTENLERYMVSHGFMVVDAFSDFPVDLYLLHSGSNYIQDPSNGREANRARMQHDVMIARGYGLDKYLDYYRAMFKVGLGRDITVIVRSMD
ncbi:MAG: class I SAM-dependent methyltransferase [Pseudohongiella sp.]|nr:class I SAM-dependent methyltransferase [Pseudohongiella sp.]